MELTTYVHICGDNYMYSLTWQAPGGRGMRSPSNRSPNVSCRCTRAIHILSSVYQASSVTQMHRLDEWPVLHQEASIKEILQKTYTQIHLRQASNQTLERARVVMWGALWQAPGGRGMRSPSNRSPIVSCRRTPTIHTLSVLHNAGIVDQMHRLDE